MLARREAEVAALKDRIAEMKLEQQQMEDEIDRAVRIRDRVSAIVQ